MHFPGEAGAEYFHPAQLLSEGRDLFGRTHWAGAGRRTEHLAQGERAGKYQANHRVKSVDCQNIKIILIRLSGFG